MCSLTRLRPRSRTVRGNFTLNVVQVAIANYRSLVFATANGYEEDTRYYQAPSQDFHLYPIHRIAAGDSTVVSVAPHDTLCANNFDSPGWGADYICRSVRIVAPTDGVMTIGLSAQGAAVPRVEVEIVWTGAGPCCSERLENPTSISVTAGTEVKADVEIAPGSTTSQSFTLTTAMVQP